MYGERGVDVELPIFVREGGGEEERVFVVALNAVREGVVQLHSLPIEFGSEGIGKAHHPQFVPECGADGPMPTA